MLLQWLQGKVKRWQKLYRDSINGFKKKINKGIIKLMFESSVISSLVLQDQGMSLLLSFGEI